MKNRNIISATILLLFGLFVLREGVSLGIKIGPLMGPGFIPFTTGLLLSVLSILLIVQSVVKGEDRGKRVSFWKTQHGWLLVFLTLCAMVTYILIFNYLGFLLSTFLLLLFLFKVVGGRKWWVAEFGGLTAAIVVYLIFEVWLQANLPRGFLGI